MFSGQRSSSGLNKGITLHWILVLIFYETGPSIWGWSYWAIIVFILDLVNMYGVLNINSFSKKLIIILAGGFIRFIHLNFMYIWTWTFEHFAWGMWIITKSTLFKSLVFWLGVFMTRLFRILQAYLHIYSAAWSALICSG